MKARRQTSTKKTRKKTKAPVSPGLVKRVLFRPDRYQYVRKKNPDVTCVFCEAAKQNLNFETLCVYKSQSSMVVLNKFPYNSGHLLVLPVKHEGHLLGLNDEEYMDLNSSLRKAIKAIETLYRPMALNIGVNHGKSAGAGIPDHLHYHIIPRWDGDLNFFPLIAETKVVIEKLEQTYDRFRKYFQENHP